MESLSRILVATFAALVACAVAVSPAHADERRRVTVLSLDAAESLGDASAELYAAVRTQIAYHRELTLNDVPPQPLNELLLALGCTSLDALCAEELIAVTNADWLVWGEVTEEGGQLTVFDLARAEVLRDASFGPPSSWVEREAVLVARQLLWGSVAGLTVRSSPLGAQVTLNGERVGVTPLTLSQLPLGGYTLRVEAAGYAASEQQIGLDLGELEVDVQLVSSVVTLAQLDAPRASTRAGIVVAAAGASLLVAGIATGVASRHTQRRFDRTVDEVALDRDRADSLSARGRRQSTATNLLLPTGGVSLLGGVVWALSAGRQVDRAP